MLASITDGDWTPEWFRFARFAREQPRNLIRLLDICNTARGSTFPLDGNRILRTAVFFLDGVAAGSAYPMWKTGIGDDLGVGCRNVIHLVFENEKTVRQFLLISCSSYYRLGIEVVLQRFGRRHIPMRVLSGIFLPWRSAGNFSGLWKQYLKVLDLQRENSEDCLRARISKIIETVLQFKDAKNPRAIEAKLRFECHARHVTGLRWDHASELLPLVKRMTDWIQTSPYEVYSLKTCFEPGMGKVELPRRVKDFQLLVKDSRKACGRGGCYVLTPSKGVDVRYLCWFLSSRITLDYLQELSVDGFVQRDDLDNLPVPVPPLRTQRMLVSRLEGLMARRERQLCECEKISKKIQMEVDNAIGGRKSNA